MKKCFIISPIGEEGSDIRNHADQVMEFILKPVLEELDYEFVRADKISTSQNISKNVISNIYEADLIIADLTSHNPNVFYELAVSHTLAKPTIQLIKKGEKIPFDISQQRTIAYELSLIGARKAGADLTGFINEFNDENTDIQNPVVDVIGLDQIKNLQTEDITVATALKELTSEIKRIQESIYNLKPNSVSEDNTTSNVLATDLVKGMSQEDKLGMYMMDKMMSNPNMSEVLMKAFLSK